MHSFKLKDSFINKYKTVKPPFGFNGLGEITYLRTYSRLKDDGEKEQWYETVRRVVEGCYSIQKRHILDNKLGWNDLRGEDSAEEMYDRIFNMKFLPPGRSLWAMGTSIVEEKGLYAALQNCAFVSTENIDKHPTKPFEFMIDMSMLGVGVGFDTKGAGKVQIKKPSQNNYYSFGDTYYIPDTREGWVESLRLVLSAYFNGTFLPYFNYSLLRKEGELIKTFGGKASGFKPLKKLHIQIIQLFKRRAAASESYYITSTDIVDIMNMIGACVVAGNVRRSAQLVIGDPADDQYLKLKDYQWNGTEYIGSASNRTEYGWTSNNSIDATIGMDYTKLAEQTANNGEPGYIWMDNVRKYSRMSEPIDNKDSKAAGTNPCGEQTLESFEMCCLVETFPTRCTDLEDYKRTLKFAYLYGKTVTLSKTHWVETNRVMLRNRRIGTSISGIAQFVDNKGLNTLKTWLNEGYKTIQYYDKVYSDWLAVPKSIKTTSIKPSGTVSLLAGVTPGIHYPESTYYIRRIRLAKNSDLLEQIIKAGYKTETSVEDPLNTLVVEIPIAVEGVRPLSDVSMWEQLSLAAFIQEHWSDNQVSCTITFNKDEKKDIAKALDYFQYRMKAISFLPKTEKGVYAQMPYEEITKEDYDKLSKNIQPLEFKNISEDSKPELYCDSTSCVIL